MATKSPLISSPQTNEIDLVDPNQIANLWFVRYGATPVAFTYESVADGYNGDDWLMRNMAIVVRSILRNNGVWKNRDSHPFGYGHDALQNYPAPLQIKVMLDNATQVIQVYVQEIPHGDR